MLNDSVLHCVLARGKHAGANLAPFVIDPAALRSIGSRYCSPRCRVWAFRHLGQKRPDYRCGRVPLPNRRGRPSPRPWRKRRRRYPMRGSTPPSWRRQRGRRTGERGITFGHAARGHENDNVQRPGRGTGRSRTCPGTAQQSRGRSQRQDPRAISACDRSSDYSDGSGALKTSYIIGSRPSCRCRPMPRTRAVAKIDAEPSTSAN